MEVSPVTQTRTETELIASASLPYHEDSKKAKYLSYRVMNFTIRESLKLADVTGRSRATWLATDPQFAAIDGEGLTERRKQLASEYINAEFTRNFRMVLEKDFRILWKSLNQAVLAKEEHEYLLKLRSHYSPQNLMMIRQILGGKEDDKPFDFTKLTLTIRREQSLEIRQER